MNDLKNITISIYTFSDNDLISLKNPYFIVFQRCECYTTLIVKELLYSKKSNFLLLFQKVL